MKVSKEVLKKEFSGQTQKSCFKSIMIFLWDFFIEKEFKPNFGENITIESARIEQTSNKNQALNSMTLTVSTEFVMEDEVKEYCKRCLNYGGFNWESKDCAQCNLFRFNEQLNKRLKKRANVQKKKVGDING